MKWGFDPPSIAHAEIRIDDELEMMGRKYVDKLPIRYRHYANQGQTLRRERDRYRLIVSLT